MRIIAAVVVAAIGGTALAQESPADPGQRIRHRLETMRISLDFTNAKLDDVIAYFREYSGLNLHLDSEARAKELESGAKVTIKVRDVALRTALKLVLNPRDLGCNYRDGVLVIATKSRLGTQSVTRVYDVRDLVSQLQDFPGPRFELDFKAPGLDSKSFFQDEPKVTFTQEYLGELIKTSTGGRTWDENSTASIIESSGLLVVTQSKSVHEEVRRLLDQLRQYK